MSIVYAERLSEMETTRNSIDCLLKEVIDNSIDEYVMGHGKRIMISVSNGKVIIRDYGRGIPLGKLLDCITKINTGAKYDSKVFKKSDFESFILIWLNVFFISLVKL